MKFFLVDSKHNSFHWLVVVLSRIVFSIFLVPLSFYAVAFGFVFSRTTFQPILPSVIYNFVMNYSRKLPYFLLIRSYIFSLLDELLKKAPFWWGLNLGIPLIILGICLFILNFFDFYYSIISDVYNHTHCPFCKKAIRIKANGYIS